MRKFLLLFSLSKDPIDVQAKCTYLQLTGKAPPEKGAEYYDLSEFSMSPFPGYSYLEHRYTFDCNDPENAVICDLNYGKLPQTCNMDDYGNFFDCVPELPTPAIPIYFVKSNSKFRVVADTFCEGLNFMRFVHRLPSGVDDHQSTVGVTSLCFETATSMTF